MHSSMACLVLVFVTVGALLMASCTASTPASPTPAPKDVKPYGSLTIGWDNFSAGTFDPAISSGLTFGILGAPIFDSLVEVGSDSQPRPGLAERWEIAPDGKTQTFYIRKGVKFHNGSDLTGADAKFSVERILAPETTIAGATIWRGLIASVELRDDYTLVLRMKQPTFELLNGFGDLNALSAVVPKKYVEEKGVDYFRKSPIGSGPWKFEKYETGSRLELEAVESHWRAVPQFKNLTILNVPDEATRVAMLKTGELDAAVVAPDSAVRLKSAGLRIVDWDGGSGTAAYLWWDWEHPEKNAFGDVMVRKALSLAVDRREMADKIFAGYAEPSSAAAFMSTSAYFYDPNVLKAEPYDPEQAKRILSEAGYPKGFKTKVWDRGMGGSLESTLCLALSGYWRRIGVEAGVTPIDFSAGLRPMIMPKPNPAVFDTVWVLNTSGVLQFERMVTVYHSTKSTIKNTKNPRLDELIDRVPLTVDPVEKKRIALDAVQVAGNEYSIINYLWLHTVLAVGPKVGALTVVKGIATLGPSYDTMTHAK